MLGYKLELPKKGLRNFTFQPPELLATYNNTVDVDLLPPYVNWTEEGWVGKVMNQVTLVTFFLKLPTQNRKHFGNVGKETRFFLWDFIVILSISCSIFSQI